MQITESGKRLEIVVMVCGANGEELPASAGDMRHRFDLWVRKIPWNRTWQPTPVFLPGESPWTEEPMGSQRVRHD